MTVPAQSPGWWQSAWSRSRSGSTMELFGRSSSFREPMKTEEKKDVNRILVEDRHLIDEALKQGVRRVKGDETLGVEGFGAYMPFAVDALAVGQKRARA